MSLSSCAVLFQRNNCFSLSKAVFDPCCLETKRLYFQCTILLVQCVSAFSYNAKFFSGQTNTASSPCSVRQLGQHSNFFTFDFTVRYHYIHRQQQVIRSETYHHYAILLILHWLRFLNNHRKCGFYFTKIKGRLSSCRHVFLTLRLSSTWIRYLR